MFSSNAISSSKKKGKRVKGFSGSKKVEKIAMAKRPIPRYGDLEIIDATLQHGAVDGIKEMPRLNSKAV